MLFTRDTSPRACTTKCIGGVADGRTMTGKGGILRAVLPHEDGNFVLSTGAPKAMGEYSQSIYLLKVLSIDVPKHGEMCFVAWVCSDLTDEQVIEKLFQNYNPVTHNSRVAGE